MELWDARNCNGKINLKNLLQICASVPFATLPHGGVVEYSQNCETILPAKTRDVEVFHGRNAGSDASDSCPWRDACG
jgi:hypothetical protein